eukprot:Hpha_TRINITY_DN16159_c1_g1::TRINITY_DN16159_c1_g1_i1::g.6220::m.6220
MPVKPSCATKKWWKHFRRVAYSMPMPTQGEARNVPLFSDGYFVASLRYVPTFRCSGLYFFPLKRCCVFVFVHVIPDVRTARFNPEICLSNNMAKTFIYFL